MDRAAKVLAELGVLLADPGDRLADRAGHPDAGTLGRRSCASIAATQANVARQLSDQEVAFGVRLCGPLGIPAPPLSAATRSSTWSSLPG